MDDPERKRCHSLTGRDSYRALCSILVLMLTSLTCASFPTGRRLPASPTATPPESSPALPSDIPIFRDDFNGQLNPAWTWQNEDASRHKMGNGWLEITGGDESLLSDGQQTNLLWTSLPEGDFVVSVHLKAQPLFDYQRVGFLLFRDSKNYISLSHGHCMQCVLGGVGVFLEYNLNEIQGRFSAAIHTNDLRLMLIVEQGCVSAFYAVEENHWQHLASLENAINFEWVALNVTNNSKWDEGYDLVGMFDFFEIRRPTQIAPTPTPNGLQQAGIFREEKTYTVTKVTSFRG